MNYLSPADLKTHIYQEYIDEIVRSDSSITQDAINAAIDLAQSYLSRYNLVALFGTSTAAPSVASPMLKKHVKDIACWFVLTLSNANIELALFETLYDNAIAWLKDIQKGLANPDWPYADKAGAASPAEGNEVTASFNPKRTQHF